MQGQEQEFLKGLGAVLLHVNHMPREAQTTLFEEYAGRTKLGSLVEVHAVELTNLFG